MQEIYKLLNSCFDCLKDTQKKCFFYSAVYPEDSNIQKDCLLHNSAAEELLDTGDGVEVKRANGREVLDYLKMVSLLEENTFQQCIRMHKLIRLAALYNLSTDDQGILKNKDLEVIPRAFFKHMQSLRVLDLYDTRITSLPNSLLKLATLKVLYLQKYVALVEIYREIENLQKLKVLDIRGSGLENIPPQVESLISLRRLLVSFTSSMSIHPTQKAANEVEVISKIPMLKELVVDVEDGLERIVYGAIVNVVRLTRLSLLQFCFSNKGKLEDLFS
ncbi:NB-ARC domains-containing protein [Tanacetum coccineum]